MLCLHLEPCACPYFLFCLCAKSLHSLRVLPVLPPRDSRACAVRTALASCSTVTASFNLGPSVPPMCTAYMYCLCVSVLQEYLDVVGGALLGRVQELLSTTLDQVRRYACMAVHGRQYTCTAGHGGSTWEAEAAVGAGGIWHSLAFVGIRAQSSLDTSQLPSRYTIILQT